MQKRWLATTALLLLPAAAGAEQFDYGVKSQAGWTNNVYGTADDATIVSAGQTEDLDPVDDWSVRVSPWGKVSDFDGNLTWSAQYRPSYEYYLQETDISDFDHEAGGEIYWRVGDRTTLVANEAYRQYHSLLRFNENAGSLTDPAVLRGQRDELIGNRTGVSLFHLVSPLDELSLNVNYTLRDYEQSNDLTSWGVASGYRHTLDARTTIGLQGSWVRQTFSRPVGDDAVTDYYNISATLDYQFSRTLRFEAYLGPALIDSDTELESFVPKYGVGRVAGGLRPIDAANCPLLNDTIPHQPDPDAPNYNPHISSLGFGGCGASGAALTRGELELLGYPRGDPLVPGSTTGQTADLTEFGDPYGLDASGNLNRVDDSDFGAIEVTYFARAALIKDWERWHGEVSYQRSSDDSGSFGASSVRDTVELSLRWEPARHWSVTLTGGYSLLDQASDVAVPSLLIIENEPVPAGVDSIAQIATVQRLVVDVDDNALTYTTASASLAANRKLSEHSSVFAALYWYQQQQKIDLDDSISFVPGVSADDESTQTWNNLTFWVGFDWQFDTYRF